MKRRTYHIRNWSEYNASLKKRGSLTVWISSEAVENWTTDELTGEPGASPTYIDLAIEAYGHYPGNLQIARSADSAKAAIPPRKGAKIWRHANTMAERHARDENLRRIRKVGVKTGRRRATIVAGAWRRLRSSVSRRSSAIGCKLARLIINSKS
jgi:hypothetical protein